MIHVRWPDFLPEPMPENVTEPLPQPLPEPLQELFPETLPENGALVIKFNFFIPSVEFLLFFLWNFCNSVYGIIVFRLWKNL